MKLKTKLIVLISGIVMVLVLSVLVILHISFSSFVRDRAHHDVTTIRQIFDAIVQDKLSNFMSQGKIVSDNTMLKDAIVRRSRGEIYTYIDSAHDKIHSDLFMAVDRSGKVLADVRKQFEPGEPVPIAKDVLESDRDETGFWLHDGQLVCTALVRLKLADQIIGSLVLGDVLEESDLEHLKTIGQCDVMMRISGHASSLSTFSPGVASELERYADSVTDLGPEGFFQTTLEGDLYYSVSVPLVDLSRASIGRIILSKSLADRMAAFKKVQWLIFFVALAVLVAAILLSYAVSRHTVHPVELLIDGSRRLQAGHLDYRIGLNRKDELGQLARAFDDMASSLKISYTQVVNAKNFSENVLRTIADSMLVVDQKGKIQSTSQSTIQILGYTAEELIGQYIQKVIRDSFAPVDYQRLYLLTRSGSLWHHEATFVPKDRDPIPVSLSAGRLVDENNDLLGFVLSAKDMRESVMLKEIQEAHKQLKEMQNNLVQSEKLSGLGQLMAGIAHELNNPLAGVLGFAQLILRHEHLDPAVRKDVERIGLEGERCRKIVENLLRFARKDTGETSMVSINEAIHRSLELILYELKVANIRVLTELDPALPGTMANPFQFQQVFLNLITNARDSMSRGGTLRVSTQLKDQSILIEFADTGVGIPPENIKKIFDPFFTTKEVGKGTGLGLSVVYGIVKNHGGDIWVESVVDGGTRFFITLPVVDAAPGTRKKTTVIRRRVPGHEPVRILVVDDEEMLLEIWKEILNTNGFILDTASRGAKALDLLKTKDFDMVISDVKMPAIGGKDIYQFILEKKPHLKGRILFVTGDAISPETSEFLKTQGLNYITKPFDLDMARKKVEEILALADA